MNLLLTLIAGVLVIWLAFLVVLIVTRPESGTLREGARVIPDTARLIHALARDRKLHRGTRVRLWMLLGYLVSPIDLVPDFIPVIGFADDVIITSLVLRSVIKRAGAEHVADHWPGTPEGLTTLFRICRFPGDDN